MTDDGRTGDDIAGQHPVPSVERPDLAGECRWQVLTVAAADATDPDLDAFMDAAFADALRDEETG